MKNYIIYNGIHSFEDMRVLVDALSIPTINEDIEHIEVVGRNGSLTVRNNSYSDRIIPFSILIIRDMHETIEEFIERVDSVNEWLEIEKEKELVTYLRTNRKYLVKSIEKKDVNIDNSRMIKIEGQFICDPFLYELNEQVITLTQSATINYQSKINGECNIKIYGTGNIQLTINDETVQINDVDEFVELDSKLFLCINKDKTSKSRDMIGHFPILTKGNNNINWTGDVSKVEILLRTAYK